MVWANAAPARAAKVRNRVADMVATWRRNYERPMACSGWTGEGVKRMERTKDVQPYLYQDEARQFTSVCWLREGREPWDDQLRGSISSINAPLFEIIHGKSMVCAITDDDDENGKDSFTRPVGRCWLSMGLLTVGGGNGMHGLGCWRGRGSGRGSGRECGRRRKAKSVSSCAQRTSSRYADPSLWDGQ